jgi:CRISPR-associated protein Cst2
MTHTVNGFMLIDAPHSALNNAGNDSSERTENIVRVKVIRKGRKVYPYVSGQALRYWWRTTLEEKFNWRTSPIEREKKIAFTSANPIEYDDDDIFGYMRALKKADGGTVTRLSVLKNSPLVSVVGQVPTEDFGVMARHQGDPVPYEHEFYSTVLKGIFSLDLGNIGVFHKSEKTGYRNMYSELEVVAEKNGAEKVENKWIMPAETRVKRAKDVLKALPYLSGGAKQTSHLTDVSPKIIILVGIDGGNHLFMNLVREENGEALIDIQALEDVISDYSDILLTDIYIGRRKGFLEELDPALKALTEKYAGSSRKIIYGSINEMVNSFVETIPELMR